MSDFTHKISHFAAFPLELTVGESKLSDPRVVVVAVRDDGEIFVLNRFAAFQMALTQGEWRQLDPIPGTPPRRAFLENEIEKALSLCQNRRDLIQDWITKGQTPPDSLEQDISEAEERIKALRTELGERAVR